MFTRQKKSISYTTPLKETSMPTLNIVNIASFSYSLTCGYEYLYFSYFMDSDNLQRNYIDILNDYDFDCNLNTGNTLIIQIPKTVKDIKKFFGVIDFQAYGHIKMFLTDSSSAYRNITNVPKSTPITLGEITDKWLYLPLNNSRNLTNRNTLKKLLHYLFTPPTDRRKLDPITFINVSKLPKQKEVKIDTGGTQEVVIDIETNGSITLSARITTINFYSNKKHTQLTCNFGYISEYKKLLKIIYDILVTFKSTGTHTIFHNAVFDIKIICYNLEKYYFNSAIDSPGTTHLKSLDLFPNIEDTMLMLHLKINSTHPVNLDLKSNTLDIFGDFHFDFDKENFILGWKPSPNWITYNAMDCEATQILYNDLKKVKFISKVYTNIFKKSILFIVEMGLSGLPTNTTKVRQLQKQVTTTRDVTLKNILQDNPLVAKFLLVLREHTQTKANEKLKVKVRPIEEFDNIQFNLDSPTQVSMFLYDFLKLPSLAKTKKGGNSVNKDTLESLVALVKNKKVECFNTSPLSFLEDMLTLSSISMMYKTFLPAFVKEDKYSINNFHLVRGNLNLAGTKSYRLSSNNPNMQNMPSSGVLGKQVKNIFEAPKGYLLATADFSSLEDRIITIQSNDPNKVAIYQEKYDSHSFNSYYYFPNKFLDLTEKIKNGADPVKTINSIQKLHGTIRAASKTVTFAMAYMGTAFTLVNKSGFSEKEAKAIVTNYEKLYKKLKKMQINNILRAKNQGYIELSFGGRLWTPDNYLGAEGKWYLNKKIQEEERTLNNAYSQTWGTLTNRAIIAVQKSIAKSTYSEDIRILNTVHDSIYFLIKEKPKAIEFLNNNLIKEMQWQEIKELEHDLITIESELEIGKTLLNLHRLENNCSLQEIQQTIKNM